MPRMHPAPPPPPLLARLLPVAVVTCAAAGGAFDATAAASCGDYLDMSGGHAAAVEVGGAFDANTPARPASDPRCDRAPRPETPPAPATVPAPPTDAVLAAAAVPRVPAGSHDWSDLIDRPAEAPAGRVERPPRG